VAQGSNGKICTYEIDPANVIISVGGNWLDFARCNGAPSLTPERVIGRSIFDFIADRGTIESLPCYVWENA
jgi:hypothetical protein